MNRQPKGTPIGGQFAEGRKPDGGDLTIATTNGVAIAQSRHIDINDKAESLDAGNMCLSCGRGSGFVNRVSADMTSEDGINVTGYICAECDGCEDDALYGYCPECKMVTVGNDDHECNYCGEAHDMSVVVEEDGLGRVLCTQCTGETNFDFDAFAKELQNEVKMSEVGSTYGGIDVAEWDASEAYNPEVLLQAWRIEGSTEGWSARSIAQILKERNIRSASMNDVLDIFDDGEIQSVAFDPKRGAHQVLMEINDDLEGVWT